MILDDVLLSKIGIVRGFDQPKMWEEKPSNIAAVTSADILDLITTSREPSRIFWCHRHKCKFNSTEILIQPSKMVKFDEIKPSNNWI